MEVGEELLRKYVFTHLQEPADKLQLMLAMLHKLYAMVSPPEPPLTLAVKGCLQQLLSDVSCCAQEVQHPARIAAVKVASTVNLHPAGVLFSYCCVSVCTCSCFCWVWRLVLEV